jgi:DMSO/TMAO reductase YedYZ molybdopterin-dependent catalytic subunit
MNDDPDALKYQSGGPPEPGSVAPDVIVSPDTRRANRIPPGQARTRKWPVLHGTVVPTIPMTEWRLTVDGLVDQPLKFNWDEFQALPRVKIFADFHCVTRWSRLGNLWEGVSVRHLLQLAGVKPQAKFVVATGYDSAWTTNLPLEEFDQEDALVAVQHDGEPLSSDHGGPARLIVPRLYAWKSAKWLKRITLLEHDLPGYWEDLGYHNYGDPWREERFTE